MRQTPGSMFKVFGITKKLSLISQIFSNLILFTFPDPLITRLAGGVRQRQMSYRAFLPLLTAAPPPPNIALQTFDQSDVQTKRQKDKRQKDRKTERQTDKKTKRQKDKKTKKSPAFLPLLTAAPAAPNIALSIIYLVINCPTTVWIILHNGFLNVLEILQYYRTQFEFLKPLGL